MRVAETGPRLMPQQLSNEIHETPVVGNNMQNTPTYGVSLQPVHGTKLLDQISAPVNRLPAVRRFGFRHRRRQKEQNFGYERNIYNKPNWAE
jgi:hypothetical protein